MAPEDTVSIIVARGADPLHLDDFHRLAGSLSGRAYVKVVYDREREALHVIDHAAYDFHANYIADRMLRIPRSDLEANLDDYNQSFYLANERRFYLGIVSLHQRDERQFFCLETVEVDTMGSEMLKEFYDVIRAAMDPSVELLLKPANHHQESVIADVDPERLPRIMNYELYGESDYVALRAGNALGHLRVFKNDAEYRVARPSIASTDIVVMDRVPDDIPRVAGIINAQPTTPLSHTNVLAHGWQIPNAVQRDVFDYIDERGLNEHWVSLVVDENATGIQLHAVSEADDVPDKPAWAHPEVRIERPEVGRTAIVSLTNLRMGDVFRYGTKAANLGELNHMLAGGSARLLGFYSVARPPRENLLPYLAKLLELRGQSELERHVLEFLRSVVRVPRGIAIPFSLQQEFLQTSPWVQQQIGKLKLALEMNVGGIDSLSLALQAMIRELRFSERIRGYIDSQIVKHLAGVSSFVIRSSSNAEDLENFSAAGIYESKNHVITAENVFDSIKEVWASLVSPRSMHLRQEVGISLDDCYMGVIVQEEVESEMGGVLVTMNPMEPKRDFRNVYMNVSTKSVTDVVQGSELPYQYLYNTVEGGGRTLSLGAADRDLPNDRKEMLQKLALVGRLLQSHFSRDYTFRAPLDIEWAISGDEIYILQIRPYPT